MMNETPNIEDEIATLSTLISQARELIATDHVIDLGNFAVKVEEFCKHVAADPPDDEERVNALIEALDSGKVVGAWLDTFSMEPYKGRLKNYNQVILTPHIASYTLEGRKAMELETVDNLIDAFLQINNG